MSLIGDQCNSCQLARERGGLAGHWWDAWANVSDVERCQGSKKQLTCLSGWRQPGLCWCRNRWYLRGGRAMLVWWQVEFPEEETLINSEPNWQLNAEPSSHSQVAKALIWMKRIKLQYLQRITIQ
jgi:hypothetical protein